jgi:hypothetical protein
MAKVVSVLPDNSTLDLHNVLRHDPAALRSLPPWRSAFVKHAFDLGFAIEIDL